MLDIRLWRVESVSMVRNNIGKHQRDMQKKKTKLMSKRNRKKNPPFFNVSPANEKKINKCRLFSPGWLKFNRTTYKIRQPQVSS